MMIMDRSSGAESPVMYRWNPYSTDSPVHVLCSPAGSSQDQNDRSGFHSRTTSTSVGTLPIIGEPAMTMTSEPLKQEDIVQFLSTLRRSENEVLTRLLDAPNDFLQALASHLASDPKVVVEQCLTDKGVLVDHVVKLVDRHMQDAILCHIPPALSTLAFTQSGCLAVRRLYDSCNIDDQSAVHQFCFDHFTELSTHQFGNYLLQKILTNVPGSASVSAVAGLAMEKDMIQLLANDAVGNYVLQQSIRFIKAMPKLKAEYAAILEALPELVKGSPNEDNICRTIAHRRRIIRT